MKAQTILENIFKQDKQQPLKASETRFVFVLLEIFNERADEQGTFCATLNEICKRYGTQNKNQVLKVRKSLVGKKVIKCTTINGILSNYEFASSNKNITTSRQKKEVQITPFKVVTPLGKTLYLSNEDNKKSAEEFCNVCCSSLMGETPQQIENFFVFWTREENNTLLYKTIQNFNILSKFKEFAL